jgi:hypothetical protein
MLLLGAVGGAVGGWFAHGALIVPAGAAGDSHPRSEVVAQHSESSARSNLPSDSTRPTPAQSGAPSSQAPTLDDLLDSTNIRCTFGPGNGGSWPQGKLMVGDASWQGGPVDFQSIDYGAGTAEMLGNVSHSRTGQMGVTVSTTSSGLNFTGVAPNGTFTAITMFPRFDNAGHHTAVLSMHDGQHDIDTVQFYGFCDSALKRLN